MRGSKPMFRPSFRGVVDVFENEGSRAAETMGVAPVTERRLPWQLGVPWEKQKKTKYAGRGTKAASYKHSSWG